MNNEHTHTNTTTHTLVSIESTSTIHEDEVDIVQKEIDRYKSSAATWTPPPITQSFEEREAALKAREEELSRREAALQNSQPVDTAGKILNFPPLYPLMHHDIDQDIPVKSQPLARLLFKSLILTVASIAFNFIAALVILIVGPSQVGSTLVNFIVATVDVVICPALALYTWYRPVYGALVGTRPVSLRFYIFFLFYGINFIWLVWKTVGFPGSGTAGLIIFIGSLASGSLIATLFAGITTFLWGLGAMFAFVMWRKVWKFTKGEGLTLEDAKRDAAFGGVMRMLFRRDAGEGQGGYRGSVSGNF